MRVEREGAERAKSPGKVMSVCEAVITCLSNPAASVSDVREKLPFAVNGKIWMKMLVTDEAELKRLGAVVIQS